MSFFDFFRKNRTQDSMDREQPVSVPENNMQTSIEPPVEAEYTPRQLMEFVKQENLSMLICSPGYNEQGFIFDHRHGPCGTILRGFESGFWSVYFQVHTKVKGEDIHLFDNWQDACKKALEYAKETRQDPDSTPQAKPQLLNWSLDDEGTLTLSGEGPMLSPLLPEYRPIDAEQMEFELEYGNRMLNEGDVELEFTLPWDAAKVRKAVIAPGLTTVKSGTFGIFSYVFNNCRFIGTYKALEEIILPETMKTLDGNSIHSCPVLEKVVIPASVCDIFEDKIGIVFRDCPCVRIHTPAGSYAEAFAKRNDIIAVTPSSAGADTGAVDTLPKNYRDFIVKETIIPADPNSNCLHGEITKTSPTKGLMGPVYTLHLTLKNAAKLDLTVYEYTYACKRECSLCHANSNAQLAFFMEETKKLLESAYGITDFRVRLAHSYYGVLETTIWKFQLQGFSFELWFEHKTNRGKLAYEIRHRENPFPDQLTAYLAEYLTELDSAF